MSEGVDLSRNQKILNDPESFGPWGQLSNSLKQKLKTHVVYLPNIFALCSPQLLIYDASIRAHYSARAARTFQDWSVLVRSSPERSAQSPRLEVLQLKAKDIKHYDSFDRDHIDNYFTV